MKTAVLHSAIILMIASAVFLLPMPVDALDDANWYEKGSELLKAHRYEEAIGAFSITIETIPHDYQAYCKRGAARYLKGDYAEAISDYHTAINMNPDDAVALHQLALILTFCPEPTFRNLPWALTSAKRAADLMHVPIFLKTLAAIQHETGDIKAAIQTQKKLIALARHRGQTQDLPAMEAQLSEYRKKIKYSDSGGSQTPKKQDVHLPLPPTASINVKPPRIRKKPDSGAPVAHAFTIHLHSFQDRSNANHAAQLLRARGEKAFVAHADIPEKGRWFRVYTGAYRLELEAMEHALALKRQKLPYARAVQRPWAVRVSPSGNDATMADLEAALRDRGYLLYRLQVDEPGNARLYGAFATEENAAAASRELKKDGFDAAVIAR